MCQSLPRNRRRDSGFRRSRRCYLTSPECTQMDIFYQKRGCGWWKCAENDQDYLDVCGYQIIRGRGFSKEDYQNYRKVVMIDETASGSFFEKGQEIRKTTIEIKGEPFTVIGVVKKTQEYEASLIARKNIIHTIATAVVFCLCQMHLSHTLWV